MECPALATTWQTTDEMEGEDSLIERAKSDPEALACLYRYHHSAIATFVRRRVSDPHQAEDVVGEVFLSMVRYLPRFKHTGIPFRAWLYRLAVSQISRWARGKRRWAQLQLVACPIDQIDSEPTNSARDSDAEIVLLTLLTLPQRLQEVLQLVYLEQLSVAETSVVLGRSVGTIKSQLSRGRELMRAQLARRGWKS